MLAEFEYFFRRKNPEKSFQFSPNKKKDSKKMRNVLRKLAVVCTFALASQASTAAILQVNSFGILTGATEVDVGGTLYDVTFADGSCNSLFNGCVSSAFTFTTV